MLVAALIGGLFCVGAVLWWQFGREERRLAHLRCPDCRITYGAEIAEIAHCEILRDHHHLEHGEPQMHVLERLERTGTLPWRVTCPACGSLAEWKPGTAELTSLTRRPPGAG